MDPSGRFNYLLAFVKGKVLGFPRGSVVKNPPAVPKTRVRSLSREDPLEEGMVTHSSVLTWRIPGTEEPVGYSPSGRKESDMSEAT